MIRALEIIPPKPSDLTIMVVFFTLAGSIFIVVALFSVVEIIRHRKQKKRRGYENMEDRLVINDESSMDNTDKASLSEPIDITQKSTWRVKYRDLEILNPPIGKGAYTVVNKAYLRGTLVAVKTYLKDYVSDVKEDFKREVNNLIKFRHPNIVLFIGATNKPLCIVTEFATRGCLYDVINLSPHLLTLDKIKELSMDICKGMAYLHSQEEPVLHRFLLKSFFFFLSHSRKKRFEVTEHFGHRKLVTSFL